MLAYENESLIRKEISQYLSVIALLSPSIHPSIHPSIYTAFLKPVWRCRSLFLLVRRKHQINYSQIKLCFVDLRMTPKVLLKVPQCVKCEPVLLATVVL